MKRKKIAEAGANKKDRERLYHDFGRSLTDGRQLTQTNATLNDAFDVYLKWCEQLHKANDRMSAGTLERIRQTIKKHLRPDLGDMLLNKITSPLIEDYIYKKSVGVRCKHFDIYHTLKKALERAVWEDLLSISPLDVKKLRLPPYPESRTGMPTIEEGRALWHSLDREGRVNARISEHCHITRMTSVALSMFGGMSCGEMCGLQWEYVNFTAPIPWIWIEHSQSRYAGAHGKLKEPKARSRHRYIVIGPEMNVWLTKTAKRDGFPRTGYVFKPEPSSYENRWGHTEGGHLLRALTGQLQQAQIRLGFVDDDGKAKWTMHDLRRYAGSVWLEMGYPIEQVSRMLGHAKIETTQRYYIKWFKQQNLERDQQMMVKVSDLHRLLAAPPAGRPAQACWRFVRDRQRSH